MSDNVIPFPAQAEHYEGNGAVEALDRVLGIGNLGEAETRTKIRDVLLGLLWTEGFKVVPFDRDNLG